MQWSPSAAGRSFCHTGRLILQSNRDAIPGVDGIACMLTVLEGVVSGALAVFLLIISIRLLRRPRQSLRPFRLFANAKLVTGVWAGLAIGWLTLSFLTSSLRGSTPAPNAVPTAASLGLLVAIIGVLYPVALLIIMRLRSVRDYYES